MLRGAASMRIMSFVKLGMNIGRGGSPSRWARLGALAALAAAFWTFGCGSGGDGEILALAATSLRDPLIELSEEYEGRTGGRVNLSFGGSQSLARQIESGAPADVFISAGAAPVEFLSDRGLIDSASVRSLLGNELVVVTLEGGPPLDSLELLLSDGVERLALADPELAPAGAYAEEALRSAGAWDGLRGKTLFGKDVRAAMSYVLVGSADAGIVYRTDAMSTDSLKIAYAVPGALHSPISYPGAAASGASNPSGARAFLDFLASDEAAVVFREFGFAGPPE